MSIVPVEGLRFELMEKVAALSMSGYSETQIARELEIKRKDVLELLVDYRSALSDDAMARDLARDHLNQMIKHYDVLIKKFYDLSLELEELQFTHQVAAQKNAAYKSIADLEAKRLDALQKAGLLDNSELGDELAEMEEKMQMVLGVLRDELCPACKVKISDTLRRLSGQVEVVQDFVDVDATVVHNHG